MNKSSSKIAENKYLENKYFMIDSSHVGTNAFTDSYVRHLESQLAKSKQENIEVKMQLKYLMERKCNGTGN